MSDLRNILKEEYIKKERRITPDSLVAMIEEIMEVTEREGGERAQQLDRPQIRVRRRLRARRVAGRHDRLEVVAEPGHRQ